MCLWTDISVWFSQINYKKRPFFNFTLKKKITFILKNILALIFSGLNFSQKLRAYPDFFLYHFFLPLTETWENWGSEKCLIQLTQRNTGQIRVKSLGLCYPVLHCYLSISSEKCCQDRNPSLGCARDIQHKPGQAVVWWHNGPDLVKFSPSRKKHWKVFILFFPLNMSLFFIKEEDEGSALVDEDKDFNWGSGKNVPLREEIVPRVRAVWATLHMLKS